MAFISIVFSRTTDALWNKDDDGNLVRVKELMSQIGPSRADADPKLRTADHSNATELITNGNAVRMNPRGEPDDRHYHMCDDRL
uniref:SFRICE_037193 n=1 Tax=Spodoptera frugiperda TaxID=7108 RepID=A0A2H1VM64_SPOFR